LRHAQGNRAIEIHPLQPDCTAAFRYHSDGSIEAKPGVREGVAARTIATLGLDTPGLKTRRRMAVAAFLEVALAERATLEQVLRQVDRLMARDADGRFVPFATAVREAIQNLSRSAREG
jgi:hypothetical protein